MELRRGVDEDEVEDCGSWMPPLRAYVVALGSLLAGASVMHNILKPDLRIPTLEAKANPKA